MSPEKEAAYRTKLNKALDAALDSVTATIQILKESVDPIQESVLH